MDTKGVIEEDPLSSPAAAGARQARKERLHKNVTKYMTLLQSLLGGSLPASIALYNLLKASSDLIQVLAFGSLTIEMFLVISGLVAGHFGNSAGSILYAKVATLATFVILLSFFSIGLCTLLNSMFLKTACGVTFGLLIFFLVVFWIKIDFLD